MLYARFSCDLIWQCLCGGSGKRQFNANGYYQDEEEKNENEKRYREDENEDEKGYR